MIRFFFFLGLVILVIVILRTLSRGGRLFDIRVTNRGLSHRGRVPGWAWSDVMEFLGQQRLPPGSSIRGFPDDGRFRIEFTGRIDEGTRQKIRNFLYIK